MILYKETIGNKGLASFIFLAIFLIGNSNILLAQDEKIKFSGQFFGDYFYNLDNVDTSKKDLNGFQFRRIFFTADMKLSPKFDGRFRLEGNQDSAPVAAGERIGLWIKDAFIRWNKIFDESDLMVGLSPTPAWMITQEAWQYRSVEKTPMDLFSVSLSRDIGVDLRGNLVKDGIFYYWIKVGNNSGQSVETNKYKRFYGLLQYKPTQNFFIDLFLDYASHADVIDPVSKTSKPNNQLLGDLFLNYRQGDNFSVGLEAFYLNKQNNYRRPENNSLADQEGFGFSVWTWITLSEKFRFVTRFDHYNPNLELEAGAISFFVAGFDYMVEKNISFIPNIEYFNYRNSGNNLIIRLTFSYNYN